MTHDKNSLQEFGRRPLSDPETRQGLEVARLPGYAVRDGIDLAEDVVNVHRFGL